MSSGDQTEMSCPQCQGAMQAARVGYATVARCVSCGGVFLRRADLGALTEAENDWHVDTGPVTEPLPRITADMTAPPPSPHKARSFVETLFG